MEYGIDRHFATRLTQNAANAPLGYSYYQPCRMVVLLVMQSKLIGALRVTATFT